MPWDDSGDYIRSGHRDPSTAKTCRTIDISADQGIKAIYCKFPDGWAIQSYLFNKDKWTMDKAKAWFAAHKESEFTEKLGETRHSDFQKIYDAFMWRYCKDKTECKEGKDYYYVWLNKLGLDDTKPYQKPQEKFSWTKPYLKFLKEDEKAKYFKCEALFPLTSMNDNVYTKDELLQAARSLVGKTVDLNHTDEKLPEVTIYDAQYEDNCVECLLRVEKESKALKLIEKEEILQVSIEADCLRGTEQTPEGNVCHGLVFTGLALLTKDVLPGVPLTRIMPVEKLVESFTVTSVTNLNELNSQNQAPPPRKPLAEMTADEIAAEIEATTRTLVDLEQQLPKVASAEQGAIRAKMNVLYAQIDGYRQALMQKIVALATAEGAKAEKVLVAAAKAAKIGDYETQEKLGEIETRLKTAETMLIELQKPKESPAPETNKGPCKCVLTKEGFWARFHQLRSEGLDKADAFRLVSIEVIEAQTKKSK